MKTLSLTLLTLISFNTFANCNVYIPEKEFLHDSGYAITFDFSPVIGPKNYVEVATMEEADYKLELEGIERVTPTFHFAVGILRMLDKEGKVLFKTTEQTRCFTQYCGISDYAKSFQKAYKGFGSGLAACH